MTPDPIILGLGALIIVAGLFLASKVRDKKRDAANDDCPF